MHYRTKVAIVYLLGFFVDLINMFIASVAYPAIGRQLHTSVAQLAWISNGYIIGLTLVIPLSVWLAYRLGAEQVFRLSLLVFICAGIAAGLADSVTALIFWRFIQGVGGGLLIPVGQALVWPLYQPHQQAKLSAAVMVVGLLAPALSPALGGMLVEWIGWRAPLFASLPPALLALILAFLWLHQGSDRPADQPLDVPGLICACSALLLLLLGLTKLSEPQQAWPAIGALFAAFGLLVYFVYRSKHQSRPLLRLALLAAPQLRLAMLVYLCVPGMFIGLNLLAMLYLQSSLRMTPSVTGALMLPWSIASFFAITVTGKSFNRLGPRPLMVAGCVLQAMGMVLLAQVNQQSQSALLVAAFVLMGAGGSLCSSSAQSSAFIGLDNAAMPDATALWNINRQLSFCLGIALLSVLFNQLCYYTTLQQAYVFTFYAAALVSLLPLLVCFRPNNRALIQRIQSESEKS